jgi:hypothetical protein
MRMIHSLELDVIPAFHDATAIPALHQVFPKTVGDTQDFNTSLTSCA